MTGLKSFRQAPTSLRRWRDHRGLTLEQVGNIVGVGPQAVHKWEQGKTPVNLETLRLLAQVYETTPSELLFDPADAETHKRMQRAYEVLRSLPADHADRWLDVGRIMADGGETKP